MRLQLQLQLPCNSRDLQQPHSPVPRPRSELHLFRGLDRVIGNLFLILVPRALLSLRSRAVGPPQRMEKTRKKVWSRDEVKFFTFPPGKSGSDLPGYLADVDPSLAAPNDLTGEISDRQRNRNIDENDTKQKRKNVPNIRSMIALMMGIS
ncbi:hypothetical protein RUM43_002749 [Polyplax serrata]|uniref:Uncharacterized protein n=1 Tax=Polyplax serrata TaxID=468196 RepID=A0AAN8PMS5_POLSC